MGNVRIAESPLENGTIPGKRKRKRRDKRRKGTWRKGEKEWEETQTKRG